MVGRLVGGLLLLGLGFASGLCRYACDSISCIMLLPELSDATDGWRDGSAVAGDTGREEGALDGFLEGRELGFAVGRRVSSKIGRLVGGSEGRLEGLGLGRFVGMLLGLDVTMGLLVGLLDGVLLGLGVSLLGLELGLAVKGALVGDIV